MFRLTTAALALSLATGAPALAQVLNVPSGTYKIDPTHVSLTWKVNHLGLSNYTARFTRIDGAIELDAKAPEKSKMTITVDPLSVRTDYPDAKKTDFDQELATGDKWFNGAKFPAITYTVTGIERLAPGKGKVTGNLTLLGITKPLTLDATLNAAKDHPMAQKPALGISATGTLKRSEWGMTNLIPYVGDEVSLLIEAEFIGEKSSMPAGAR